jgi:hypothetical protein
MSQDDDYHILRFWTSCLRLSLDQILFLASQSVTTIDARRAEKGEYEKAQSLYNDRAFLFNTASKIKKLINYLANFTATDLPT